MTVLSEAPSRFRYSLAFSGVTVSTGNLEACTTLSVTLPKMPRAMAFRPCVDMAMIPHPSSSATRRTSSAGLPMLDRTLTVIPFPLSPPATASSSSDTFAIAALSI